MGARGGRLGDETFGGPGADRAGQGLLRARELRRRSRRRWRGSPIRTRLRTSRRIPATSTRCSLESRPNWRGWLLTRDSLWRSLALARAAAADFPVAHLPTTWGNELVGAASSGVAPETTDTRSRRRATRRRLSLGSRRSIAASRDHDGQRDAARRVPDHARARRRIFRADGHVDSRNRESAQAHQLHARLQLRQSREHPDAVLVANRSTTCTRSIRATATCRCCCYWCYTTLQRMDDAPSREAAPRTCGRFSPSNTRTVRRRASSWRRSSSAA